MEAKKLKQHLRIIRVRRNTLVFLNADVDKAIRLERQWPLNKDALDQLVHYLLHVKCCPPLFSSFIHFILHIGKPRRFRNYLSSLSKCHDSCNVRRRQKIKILYEARVPLVCFLLAWSRTPVTSWYWERESERAQGHNAEEVLSLVNL